MTGAQQPAAAARGDDTAPLLAQRSDGARLAAGATVLGIARERGADLSGSRTTGDEGGSTGHGADALGADLPRWACLAAGPAILIVGGGDDAEAATLELTRDAARCAEPAAIAELTLRADVAAAATVPGVRPRIRAEAAALELARETARRAAARPVAELARGASVAAAAAVPGIRLDVRAEAAAVELTRDAARRTEPAAVAELARGADGPAAAAVLGIRPRVRAEAAAR